MNIFNRIKKSIGLEIDDTCIRILEISIINGERLVSATSEICLEEGIVEKGLVKKEEELAVKLKKAFLDAKPQAIKSKEICFALPDELTYVHIFRIDTEVKKDIKQLLDEEYKSSIPLTEEERVVAYKIIEKSVPGNENLSTIVTVAAAKKSIQVWQDFFLKQNLQIEFFDTEALALYFGLFTERQNKTFGILNIKERYSKFSIFSSTGLKYEFSSPIGLQKFSLAKNLALASLMTELNENILYASNQMLGGQKNNDKAENLFKEIIICGEGANSMVLVDYLKKNYPVFNFSLGKGHISSNTLDRKYLEVLGLATRPLVHVWEKSDPVLPITESPHTPEYKKHNQRLELVEVLRKLKKYYYIPLGIIFLIFNLWWLSGKIISPLNPENIKPDNNVVLLENPTEAVELKKVEEKKIVVKATTSVPVNTSTQKPKPVTKFVEIKKISGTLNVRQGPGTDFKTIAKVDSGSKLALLEEKSGWYKIEFESKKTGWINSNFAIKK